MIIGIVGDTHFGISKWYEESMSQGRDALVKAAKLSDVILLAGDVFHVNQPGIRVLNDVISIFREVGNIKEWDVQLFDGEDELHTPPIIAIHGNHERATRGNVDPVRFLSNLGLLVDADDRVIRIHKGDDRVAVHCMGDVLDDLAREKLNQLNFKPLPGYVNLLMIHQSLQEVMFPDPNILSVKDLPHGFDLYICGHIHTRHELPEHNLLIPGSTVITQLEEPETKEKGFYLYDTETKKLTFHPIKQRPFIFRTITFENGSLAEIEEKVKEEVNNILESFAGRDENPIIKIQLTGTVKPGVDLSGIKFKFNHPDVYISSKLSSQELERKVQLIRELREKKVSLRDIGTMAIAKKLGDVDVDKLSQLLDIVEEDEKQALSMIEERLRERLSEEGRRNSNHDRPG